MNPKIKTKEDFSYAEFLSNESELPGRMKQDLIEPQCKCLKHLTALCWEGPFYVGLSLELGEPAIFCDN